MARVTSCTVLSNRPRMRSRQNMNQTSSTPGIPAFRKGVRSISNYTPCRSSSRVTMLHPSLTVVLCPSMKNASLMPIAP